MIDDESDAGDAVAVVGMSCRLPGGIGSVDDLWRLLIDGREIPPAVPDARSGRRREAPFDVPAEPPGRYFDGDALTGLDAGFFRLSPREAAHIDPQQRLLMELTWEACQDAGFVPDRVRGPVGAFVAQWSDEFGVPHGTGTPDLYGVMGRGRYAASGRLAHHFGFGGPAMTVDTACSSSLVALHLAAAAIRAGDCDTAVVGAANVVFGDSTTVAFDDAGMLSADGRCRFGDASADGYGRAEGAAVVVLRRLDRALADRDRIHAVIEASSVTNDGPSSRSLVAPSVDGQRRAIEQAWGRAGVDLRAAGYIEAHGTGTTGGDGSELAALIDALTAAGEPLGRPCPVGSIKSNLGHTECTAGLLGLIKAALVLRHRTVPATLHVERPNAVLERSVDTIRLVTEPEPLRRDHAGIGIAGFGISGTNAHVVVGPAPTAEPEPDRSGGEGSSAVPIVPVSARSPEALTALAGALAERIAAGPDELPAIAATLRSRRTHLPHRAAVPTAEPERVIAALRALAAGDDHPDLETGRVPAGGGTGAGAGERRPDEPVDPQTMALAFVTGAVSPADLGWNEVVPPVDLPPYPWQRQRAWPTGIDPSAPTGDAAPGERLPALAHRRNEHVWQRRWSADGLADLMAEPARLAELATAAAAQVHDAEWSATVDHTSGVEPAATERGGGRSDGSDLSTQLLIVDGPSPRFELFLGSGAGWTPVADGSLERVDGYPLPAVVGPALRQLSTRRRHGWLAKRIAEQAAIALGRPPTATLDRHAVLGSAGLGLDPAALAALGTRLNAMMGRGDADTAATAVTSIDEVTTRLLDLPTAPDLDPGGDDRTEGSAGEATGDLALRLAALLDEAPDPPNSIPKPSRATDSSL